MEIDEGCVSKRKLKKGRMLGNKWCVGGISKKSKKFFFHVTDKCDSEELNEIIEKNLKLGTLIITDG